jgi:hypothetical protein
MSFRLNMSMAAVLTFWLQAAFMAQLQTDAGARLNRVPGIFQRQLAVLGNRMQVSGKELTTSLTSESSWTRRAIVRRRASFIKHRAWCAWTDLSLGRRRYPLTASALLV